ncbi:hypothetical protein NHX12_033726 [Muraenolepis orangiensis]|uniref:Uncharacterized protein n=1 Tax=Muraenolepis orangiensis TaxID=630683 RepID=A0A9Q0IJ22_9TELE|nr:hypothetical protein NHX12_033726 [Muraenolepis orangiensis]
MRGGQGGHRDTLLSSSNHVTRRGCAAEEPQTHGVMTAEGARMRFVCALLLLMCTVPGTRAGNGAGGNGPTGAGGNASSLSTKARSCADLRQFYTGKGFTLNAVPQTEISAEIRHPGTSDSFVSHGDERLVLHPTALIIHQPASWDLNRPSYSTLTTHVKKKKGYVPFHVQINICRLSSAKP